MKDLDQEKKEKTLEDPFPDKGKDPSLPGKDEPLESGSTLSGIEKAAAAAKEELTELCSDAAEGFHSIIQWKYPKVPALQEKQQRRIGKSLYKNLEAAGVKVSPGLGLAVVLAATYAPMLKYMKSEPKKHEDKKAEAVRDILGNGRIPKTIPEVVLNTPGTPGRDADGNIISLKDMAGAAGLEE